MRAFGLEPEQRVVRPGHDGPGGFLKGDKLRDSQDRLERIGDIR